MISTLIRHLLFFLSNLSLVFHVLKPRKGSLAQIWLELSFPYILSAKRDIKPPLFYFPSKSEAGAEVGISMSSHPCNCYLTWASYFFMEREVGLSILSYLTQRPVADTTACLWPWLSRAATISFRGTSGVTW